MLLDSNIIIYAIQPENAQLWQFIADNAPAVPALSYVEVLGYHRLTEADRTDLEEFFRIAPMFSSCCKSSKLVISDPMELGGASRIGTSESVCVASCCGEFSCEGIGCIIFSLARCRICSFMICLQLSLKEPWFELHDRSCKPTSTQNSFSINWSISVNENQPSEHAPRPVFYSRHTAPHSRSPRLPQPSSASIT